MREKLKQILDVTNQELNSLQTDYANVYDVEGCFHGESGREHYRLLMYISQIFRGVLPRDDTHKDAFKKAKMFAMLTTIPEAFGRTNIEAISKGTPVLGSTFGSVPELVNHQDVGFCSDNIDELVYAIKHKNFDYKKCYDFAYNNYHVKNEINGLIEYTYNNFKVEK